MTLDGVLRLRASRVVSIAVVTVAASLASAASAQAAANLIPNGGFEGTAAKGSLGGWAGSGGTLSLVAGNGGGHAAKLSATAASAAQMYAFTKSKPVKNAVAGSVYTLSGQVQAATPGQPVCLIIKELVGATTRMAASAQACITPTAAWQSFPPVSITIRTTGDSLTVNVQQKPRPAGAAFAIDNVALVAGAADTQAPTVPDNVQAASAGVSAVTVTWAPSSDDSGSVAGHRVYRGGNLVGTVAGTAGSFTDSGLAPATSYSYTVSAFDPSGNSSSQSAPAGATTDTAPPAPCGLLQGSGPHVYDHVVVVMEENLNYNAWRGAANAPYSNLLASQCALATNFSALTHPSQQNYVGTLTGTVPVQNAMIGDDNLLHQLGAAGKSWAGLNESMSTNCMATSGGIYTSGHNPATFLTDLGAAGDSSCATSDVPFTVGGFSTAMLGTFTWLTPNLCDDMHWQASCPELKANAVATGDSWLQRVLPVIFASSEYQSGKTLVLLTWDEGEGTGGNKGINCLTAANLDTTGCHIGLVAASAYVTPGTTDGTALSLYSVLSSLETMWQLPLLGNAPSANPLGPNFGF